MLNIGRIKEMVGISSLELLEIQDHQDYLAQQTEDFQKDLEVWLTSFDIHCEQQDMEIMLQEYYRAVVSGDYGQDFYVVQYRQAMRWRLCGLSQSKSLLLMSHIRKLFIMYAEQVESHNLAKGLCHVLDMSQSIVATVYQISEEVDRMRLHVANEFKRIERSFSLISMKPPIELVQPYLDHQEWKFLAFSVALGENIENQVLELSHQKCRLAHWLETGGEAMIPVAARAKFHASHKKIHQLGAMVLQLADLKQPEKVLDLLVEMDTASSIVSDVLLNVIEDEFIRLATSDALTGMPNKRSFDIDFEKNIAFAERRNYWIGLVLIDVDYFKKINDTYGHLVGDEVLKNLALIIREAARTEETTYRWGGEEFAVLTLDEKPGGAAQLAERVRKAVENHVFCQGKDYQMKLTVSCGSICFCPPINSPCHEVFAMVDKQLYKAKEKGRNRVEHLILDDDKITK